MLLRGFPPEINPRARIDPQPFPDLRATLLQGVVVIHQMELDVVVRPGVGDAQVRVDEVITLAVDDRHGDGEAKVAFIVFAGILNELSGEAP